MLQHRSSQRGTSPDTAAAKKKGRETRFYTLVWDSADVLGHEEKQARARIWRRSTSEGGPCEADDASTLYLACAAPRGPN